MPYVCKLAQLEVEEIRKFALNRTIGASTMNINSRILAATAIILSASAIAVAYAAITIAHAATDAAETYSEATREEIRASIFSS